MADGRVGKPKNRNAIDVLGRDALMEFISLVDEGLGQGKPELHKRLMNLKKRIIDCTDEHVMRHTMDLSKGRKRAGRPCSVPR